MARSPRITASLTQWMSPAPAPATPPPPPPQGPLPPVLQQQHYNSNNNNNNKQTNKQTNKQPNKQQQQQQTAWLSQVAEYPRETNLQWIASIKAFFLHSVLAAGKDKASRKINHGPDEIHDFSTNVVRIDLRPGTQWGNLDTWDGSTGQLDAFLDCTGHQVECLRGEAILEESLLPWGRLCSEKKWSIVLCLPT